MTKATIHLLPLGFGIKSAFMMMIIVSLFDLSLVGVIKYCSKGYHKDKVPGTGVKNCVPCDAGTFMSSDKHSHDKCWRCKSKPLEGSLEEVKRPCTSTSDTEIGCVENAYNIYPSSGNILCKTCKKCQKGEVEMMACTEYHDRKCKTVVSNPDKSNAEEKTDNSSDNKNNKEDNGKDDNDNDSLSDRVFSEEITCSKGHHKDKDPDTGVERCVVCEKGTFMSSDNHNHDKCWPCMSEPPEGSKKEVKRPCTWKTDTNIGCIGNTYRHPVSFDGYTCMPCTECQKREVQVKECTEFQDRKCKSDGLKPEKSNGEEKSAVDDNNKSLDDELDDNKDKKDNGDNDTNNDNTKNDAGKNDCQVDIDKYKYKNHATIDTDTPITTVCNTNIDNSKNYGLELVYCVIVLIVLLVVILIVLLIMYCKTLRPIQQSLQNINTKTPENMELLQNE